MNEKKCSDKNCEDTGEGGRWTLVMYEGRFQLLPCKVCNPSKAKQEKVKSSGDPNWQQNYGMDISRGLRRGWR